MPGNDDVVRPIKQGDDNKIDGAISLIMTIGRVLILVKDGSGNLSDFLSKPIIVG
jgi:hypothetical protein